MSPKSISKLYKRDGRFYAQVHGSQGFGWYFIGSHPWSKWTRSESFTIGEYKVGDLTLIGRNVLLK
ncbi:MAG: hypothetical protein [Caudoviricetes sp.]|nr:MAG: hypothetical protein [Caudoviricetes sp.]